MALLDLQGMETTPQHGGFSGSSGSRHSCASSASMHACGGGSNLSVMMCH